MTDRESIQAWFRAWGACVASLDFASARTQFSDDVSGFGTFKDFVHGLDALEAGQWRSIWPTIADFEFQVDTLEALVAPDRLFASAALVWTSNGIDANGAPFPRPGRATVALSRADLDAPWLGLHTHFSLFPAERKLSFGDSA
jgi:ketosteroid isomerase-like protein